MSIEAIAAASSLQALAPTGMTTVAQPPRSDFAGVLDQISTLSNQIQSNDGALQSVALGQSDNLHQVMMSLESARLQLDLMLQVRNKIMDAYQELMRMQV